MTPKDVHQRWLLLADRCAQDAADIRASYTRLIVCGWIAIPFSIAAPIHLAIALTPAFLWLLWSPVFFSFWTRHCYKTRANITTQFFRHREDALQGAKQIEPYL